MNILILTREGKGLGLAHRLTREGHDVSIFSAHVNLENHTGFFKNSDSLWSSVKEAKYIITDYPEWGHLAKKIAVYNRPVIGMSEVLEPMNKDYVKQYQLLNHVGINTPRTKVFNDASEMFGAMVDWDAARTIIRYDFQEIRCDYRDWVAWGMTRIPLGKKVLFQEVTAGMEYQVSGWFNGLRWVDSFGIAPAISGEIYKFATIFPVKPDNKLVAGTLLKLDSVLKSVEYHGPVYIRVNVNRDDICATHIHLGLMYPISYTQLEFIEGELGEFLHNIAYSLPVDPKKTKDFVSVIQADCTQKEFVGAPILGVNNERLKHLVFHNVSLVDNEYRLADGRCVYTATAHGPSLEESVARAHMTADNIKFPEKHFNTNLTSMANPYFSKLRDWKYI